MVRKKNSEKKIPSVKFVVCSTPRCGSTYLCDVLAHILLSKDEREAYLPYEPSLDFMKKYGDKVFDKNNVKRFLDKFITKYGFIKIHYSQLENIFVNKNHNELYVCPEDSKKYFPGDVKYVYIYRSDIVSQAVSYFKAKRLLYWYTKHRSENTAISKKDFNLAQIRDNMFRLKRSNRLWEAYFKKNNITPIRVEYETFSNNTSSEIKRILNELGIHDVYVDKIKTSLQKQSDSLNTYFIQRYKKEENWYLFDLRYFIYLFKTNFYMRSFFWKKRFPLYKKMVFMYKRMLRYFV